MGYLRAILLVTVILMAGYVLPKALIPDGTDNFEGLERYGAKYNLSGFEDGALSDPGPGEILISFLTIAYRIEDIGLCNGLPTSEPDEPPLVYEEDPMTPKEEEAFIRENQSPEFRGYPMEVFTGYWQMKIQRYTPFGIPFFRESTNCHDRR